VNRGTEIIADGARLECQWVGPPAGGKPVVVFLHEGLGCVELWRDFPQQLCDQLGLAGFVYSRVGYGRSDACALPRPVTYMHHEGQAVLPQVLDAAGIEQAILVGHSDGGSISLIHTGCDKSGRIKGLVTLAAHIFNEDICVASIEEAKRLYRQGDMRARLEKYHGVNVDCAFVGWNDVWLHRDFRGWNIEEFLSAINVPLLVVQGRDDPYGTMDQVEGIIAGVSGVVERAIIPECQHSPHAQQPQATRDAIARFIRANCL
jgi:pimeloyl-ACP methyl ester carboxylesterase